MLDATSALIPEGDVQVYKRGKYPDEPLTMLKTSEVRRFEAFLEPGIYTVIFRKFGFASEFVELEISPDDSEKELHETLQVAATDICN